MYRWGARALIALCAVLAASLAFGASGATAGRVDPPGHQDGNQCINASGVDLNALYGVSEQFRTRECQVISAGEHWILPLWWIVNFEAGSVYPAGYVPSRTAPIDDLVSKLVAVKIVVDPARARRGPMSSHRAQWYAPTSTPSNSIPAHLGHRSRWPRCSRGCVR
jgi:hypothetical protein